MMMIIIKNNNNNNNTIWFFVLVAASFISLIDVKTDVSLVMFPARGASLVGQLERLLFFLEGGSWCSEKQLQIEMDWHIDFSFSEGKGKKTSGDK